MIPERSIQVNFYNLNSEPENIYILFCCRDSNAQTNNVPNGSRGVVKRSRGGVLYTVETANAQGNMTGI